MPSPADIRALAEALADAKVIGIDASAGQYIKGVGDDVPDPECPWYVICGYHYVIVPTGHQCDHGTPGPIVPPPAGGSGGPVS